MASDIEQLQKLNEQLIKTEKLAAMGTLASGIAHEVNNPLASISSIIQLLQTKQALDQDTQEMLRLVGTQINRISQVTTDMMDFARVRPSARSPVDLNVVLESSLRLASFDKSFQDLCIIKNFDESVPKVSADSDQLQQVFLNLLLNARDAMPGGGKLELTTGYLIETKEVVVEVADSGSGIAPADVKQIFDPFFSTKPTGKGTGLGLAVCYGIVTAHGGRIEVKQNNLEGSTFVVYLPIILVNQIKQNSN
jgi:signal transduction histidine kinase